MPLPLILGTNAVTGGYDVANSCRFDDGSSTQMNKTISSTSTTWTFSCWIKHTPTNLNQYLISWDLSGGESLGIGIERTSQSTQLFIYNSATGQAPKLYDGKLRDPSAWYNIVIKNSSGTITSYINGTQANTSITGTALASGTLRVGCWTAGNYFYNGYMSEVVLIDGTAYDADSFGEFDSNSPNIWKPIDVSGLTFGSDGFYLDFEDSSNLGNDANGGTDLTEANLTATDQSTDTCTNNFATLNPLANLTGSPTFSEGNLKVAGDNSANHNWQTTFVVSSGKWYWELKDLTSSPDGSLLFYDQSISSGSHPGYGFVLNTKKKVIGGSVTGSAIGSSAQNDIWSMALDLDNGKMFIARNGTYLESGDPANGTNPFIQTSDGLPSEGVFGGHVYNGSMELNFGSPSFTISSGNADANGYGNFEYAVPSGYFSLCTKNLAEYG